MTNGDKIRSMTDQELARLLDNSLEFFSCDECEKENNDIGCDDCEAWILKFLQKDEG